MPKFLKIFFLFVFLTTFSNKVLAQELFDTEFDVTYEMGSKGIVQITQDISITNKRGDVVATDYSLTVKDMTIFDVIGLDEDGELLLETFVDGVTTILNAQFNKQVIGIDRSYEWQLKYKSKDIATKVGEVWNVNIPKVEILDATKNYNITLIVPKTLGPKIFVSPKPTTETEQDTTFTYFFDKNTLMERGISASFGKHQILNFQLQYHLNNDKTFTNYQQIAFPPDISGRQQIFYDSITPLPEKIELDGDGNVLATYKVSGNSDIFVRLTGSAKISSKQINPEFGEKVGEIPSDLRRKYTKGDLYWEVNTAAIQKIADFLSNKDLTTSQNAQKVYDYVTSNLNYDFNLGEKETVTRHGALQAATNPGPWACMEFTDLFITILRAMGIPARELNGYASTKESSLTPLSINLSGGDFLHSWAEYFDPSFGWVQVDPTWGTTSNVDYFTKLDTSHFVFSIKGQDSERPFPAGAYKVDGSEKQVEVDVAQDPASTKFTESFQVYKKTNFNLFKYLQKQNKYLLLNTGGLRLFNVNHSGKDVLPFSSQIIYLPKNTNKLYFEDFNGEEFEKEFEIEKGRAPKVPPSNSSLYVVAFLALLLCVTIYGLVFFPSVLNKLSLPLRHHPRDQDQ